METTTSPVIVQARRAELYAAHNPAGTTFTRSLGPKARARGLRGSEWTAADLAELIPAGGAAVVYISFGHVRGVEGFGRQTLVLDGDRVSVIDRAGNVSISYPLAALSRSYRMLVK